jgi:hypothetical protein
MLKLEVTNAVRDSKGQVEIQADLSFQLRAKKGKEGEDDEEGVQGAYIVSGRVESQGRALSLDPVPGSWKAKPKNFVMVGLQGVVSRSAQRGYVRYAGSIPIFGCDNFELTSQSNPDAPPGQGRDEAPASASSSESQVDLSPSDLAAKQQRALWNSALARLAESLAAAQKRWRIELQSLIAEKGSGKKNATATTQVQQLFEAARTAGLVSFELTTADGEQFVVKIGR